MIPLLTSHEMRSLEARAIEEWGIPALVLQEHAALGALALIPPGEPIQVLAGPGNNGGDALALARLAHLRGRQVEVWALDAEARWKGDAALQAQLWQGLGGSFRYTRKPEEAVKSFRGWVVDGLFGLGVRLPLRGAAEAWATALHRAVMGRSEPPFRVLALDLPTGLDPSSTDVVGPAVLAHATACFGHRKVCHGLRPARAFCGDITVVPLPLPGPPESQLRLIDRPGTAFPGRWDTHKRDFGHVAIRAGVPGMGGAAVLAALGALCTGAGLVTVLTHPEVRSEVAIQVPEAMVRAWEGRLPEGIDALLVGPGGIEDIPDWEGPLVLDASALREGEGPRWMQRPQTVLTPHPGEFSRLFGEKKPLGMTTSERLARARAVAKGPGILALKGAQSVIVGASDALTWVNTTGHRGLSTGGSGDFLAGMVLAKVGHWARERRGTAPCAVELKERVAEALWLHGAAADRLGAGPLRVGDLGPSLMALQRDIAP